MPSAMLQAPFTRHEYRYNIAIRSKQAPPNGSLLGLSRY